MSDQFRSQTKKVRRQRAKGILGNIVSKVKKPSIKLERTSKSFINLVLTSALLIAGCAAFFSIFGLSSLFSGAFYSVVIMASSLEIGKLVTASLLYRQWGRFNYLFRTYYLTAVLTLVIITSIGIYGYLSSAYQKSTLELKQQMQQKEYVLEQINNVEQDRIYLKQELEILVESFPENYITAKRKARTDYNPQIGALSQSINNLKNKLYEIEASMLNTDIDVGPIVFVASSLGWDIDRTVNTLIIILICVFDPLAVMLIIGYNKLLMELSGQK